MGPLVDTNVLSELTRRDPNPGVLAWAAAIREISLSVVTLEEIEHGLSHKPNARVRRWFESFFETHCTLVPITEPIARRAGRLRGRLAANGRPRTQADMLIAATAAAHDLTLVTRNERDFSGCAIAILNPFTER